MVTIGTEGTCQRCKQRGMEAEERNFEERAECPYCGLYYEVTSVSFIASHYLPEPVVEHTLEWERLIHLLRAEGWQISGERCYRVGVILRPISVAPHFHIINTWFMIPTPLLEQEVNGAVSEAVLSASDAQVKVTWFTFDGTPAPRFQRNQWIIELDPDAS